MSLLAEIESAASGLRGPDPVVPESIVKAHAVLVKCADTLDAVTKERDQWKELHRALLVEHLELKKQARERLNQWTY